MLSIFLLSFVLLSFIVWKRFQNRGRLPLPPGPRPLPIIGNVLDVPTTYQWLTFNKWAKQYGDVVHIDALGQHIIILDSMQAVSDFFEKKSRIYSDRARMPMLIELSGFDWHLVMMPYGERWRKHRRLFHQHFHAGVVEKYQPIQILETHRLLNRLLVNPEGFFHHIRHTFGAAIMSIGYGIQVLEENDPYVHLAETSIDRLAEGVPGAFLVDSLPILKYVPTWFPGAGFQKKAIDSRQIGVQTRNLPMEAVKHSLQQGIAVSSVAATALQDLPDGKDNSEGEDLIKNFLASAYSAGADTTVSSVQNFFMAMAMYPDVQKRAQEELDTVVGHARLPDFGDHDNLPYINAIAKEALRWQPVTPLAVPHCAMADDEYNGYFIPKGSVVVGNAWSILHDPTAYPDPENFKPERFLKDGKPNPDVRDPHVAAFGWGRRLCPGRFLSENMVYMIMSSVLAVFDITPPLDKFGKPVQLKPAMSSGILSLPAPFNCVIRPRSSAASSLIRECQI